MATQSNDWIVIDYLPTAVDQSDRRSNKRYPISLEVEYQVPDGNGARRKGFGRTINISSGGVLLEISNPLQNLCPILLAINWPFLLDGLNPLKLLIHGKIVRVAGNTIAIEVNRHAFHLAGHGRQQA